MGWDGDNCCIISCIVGGGVWGGEGVNLKFMFSQWVGITAL